MQTLFVESDNLITVDEVKNTATDVYITDATVNATLYESDGTTEVSGETWPIVLSYVANTNGRYEGTIEDTVSLVSNVRYRLKIIVDGGTNLKMTIWVPMRAHTAAV